MRNIYYILLLLLFASCSKEENKQEYKLGKYMYYQILDANTAHIVLHSSTDCPEYKKNYGSERVLIENCAGRLNWCCTTCIDEEMYDSIKSIVDKKIREESY